MVEFVKNKCFQKIVLNDCKFKFVKGEYILMTSNTSRIAKNTLILYSRQILIMLVSLYTVRIVLNALGAQDYGIYNVVAGVVAMFSFLSSAMATASQRYFSYDLGKNDEEHLKMTFSLTVSIYFILAAIVVVLAESVGLWFVMKRLFVPAERMHAARIIYQFSILSFVFTILTGPFMADIIAHEDMNIYAYVSIVEVALKLVVIFLIRIFTADKLIFYGLLMLFVTIINTTIYRAICKKKYSECKYKFCWDRKYAKEMFSFTGWSLFGAFTSMARLQAITILVNQFFNPVVVAARTISNQVTNSLNVFSSNFDTSLYAPIVKEYAKDDKDSFFSLIYNGCKITFFLMWIFALPLCLRMDYVLTLWLKNLPEYVVIFSILSIVEVQINAVSYPLMTAARATGKVKLYEITLGTLQLMMFVASFVWLRFFNGKATAVFWTAIYLNIVMFFARLLIVKRLVKLSLRRYVVKVFIPIVLVIFISFIPSYFLNKVIQQTFLGLCIVVICTLLLSTVAMYYLGLSKEWRKKITAKIIGRIKLNSRLVEGVNND